MRAVTDSNTLLLQGNLIAKPISASHLQFTVSATRYPYPHRHNVTAAYSELAKVREDCCQYYCRKGS